MPINYLDQSEAYRPAEISTLLIGEAPPPSGESYFYLPCQLRQNVSIEMDRSLPATIFHHYFQRRPVDAAEYHELLCKLQEMGIFLIDIHDENIRVRNNEEGLQRVVEAIPKLREKIKGRGIQIDDPSITFLLARRIYSSVIRQHFPFSRRITWKDFRMTPEIKKSY